MLSPLCRSQCVWLVHSSSRRSNHNSILTSNAKSSTHRWTLYQVYEEYRSSKKSNSTYQYKSLERLWSPLSNGVANRMSSQPYSEGRPCITCYMYWYASSVKFVYYTIFLSPVRRYARTLRIRTQNSITYHAAVVHGTCVFMHKYPYSRGTKQ